jgi:predicted DNA-binding protein (MmcQ/YjbR family)
MTPDELRAACLDLPGAVETEPFGPGVFVFKGPNGKMFALSRLEDPLEVSLKCDPDVGAALRHEHRSIIEGYHLNKRHWITVTFGGDAPDGMVLELIEDSYDLVAAPPKRRG